MVATKEICREIERYFIADIDDPRLDQLEGGRYFSDKSKCEEGRQMIEDLDVNEGIPTKVYTVKITLVDD